MQKAGYQLVAPGSSSTTFKDRKLNIGIDLYKQVAVSSIVYLDKRKLAEHVTTAKTSDDKDIRILKPEADLACIVSHSVIKEQMYTLSEYYTFIHYLRQMNINKFIRIVDQNNLLSTARTHATITALLHNTVHGTIPEGLQQILNCFGVENFETARLIKNRLETPHKYHPITVARSLEIAKGTETRKRMGAQLIQMLNPNVSRDFVKQFINHMMRGTY
jgi:hypothetical protein